MQATGSVFDCEIELGEGFYPSGQDPFWSLKRLEPFQAVVVRSQDYLVA